MFNESEKELNQIDNDKLTFESIGGGFKLYQFKNKKSNDI
jgi:hypothetical protein